VLLLLKLAESLFSFFYVGQGEPAGFDEMGHHRLGSPTKQREQVVDQLSLGDVAADAGFEDMEIADLPDATEGFLAFQTVNRGLDGGVGWSLFLRETLLNFPVLGAATGPESFHDLELQLREFRVRHLISYCCVHYYYACSRCQDLFRGNIH
jgi:hypothetical protein